ncbi:hypothetical protein [Alienimonas californiensis]|uniref:Lipoprotein n=1 Tax=Alienimonas californiensis TaxID=2527989 RepID=A0A517PCC2_9PLAN|nr:hypothetical protein [Alienimonas californiensis]QDT17020.1 hypothetical protein CA12_31310 [Alienimonas californiensis]
MTRRRLPPPSRRLALLACAALLCAGPGCAWTTKNQGPWHGRPTLRPETTRDELVRHINEQAARTAGWQCRTLTVQMPGAPADASGLIAVEYPRRLRLKAKAMMIPVADVGSNADRVWCWVNPKVGGPGPETLTCKHASFDAVRCAAENSGGMQIPFDPDWLMEVLGVVPLDPRAVSLQKSPNDGPIWHLVSHRTDASGRRVLRVIDVDREHGQILAHELRDAATGAPLARAELQDHRRCLGAEVVLPHTIILSWPSVGLAGMTLRLKDIEVNPRNLPDDLWSLPGGQQVRHLDDGGRITTAAAVRSQDR